MKRFLLFLAILSSVIAFAQKSNPSDLINAEKSFAGYSVANGTKAAFLQFADSNAVVFDAGKPVNAKESWSKREARPGVLNWYPIYGEISISGDLGFTTGPWTFQLKTVTDSVVARGQYSTVWRKTKNGEWKFITDLGNSNTPSLDDWTFTTTELSHSFTAANNQNLLKAEEDFIAHTKENAERQKQYAAAISKQACLLNRNGQTPAFAPSDFTDRISSMPASIAYTINGSGISQAGDLGYVYGTTLITAKADNYLRIWRREGNEWKLALEVLRY